MLKNSIQIGVVLILSFNAHSQNPPNIGTGQGQGSAEYWSRAGNNGGSNNVFGTKINTPIYTVTGNGFALNGNTYRTKLNAIFTNVSNQYSISGYGWNQGVNTSGYMLLGGNVNSISDNQNLYTKKGAFSLLHINGPGSGLQEFGYRPWMQTGITFTGNRDLSYFGLRQVGTGEDVTETTITWSDNSGTSFPGSDDMVFRFTGNGNGSNLISTNYTTPDDLDGLHIARFAPTGEFALGNTFGINAPGTPANLYVRPQSLMHLSLNGNREV